MEKKIKVLQLGSPSGMYGAERWIIALIKYLDTEKIESWVGSIKDAPALEVLVCQEARKLGFPSHILECYGKLNFSAVTVLRKFIKNNRINIVHTHGYKTDIIGCLATFGTSCKIVTTPHGWTQRPNFKLWFYELVDRLAFPFFDRVVPLSEALFSSLRRIPWLRSKLQLIRNGVDIGEIDNAKNISDEIVAMKREGAFVIGYIGRLTSGKGLDVLFNAIAKYGEPHWRVVIVGEGEQSEELESIVVELDIADRVKFYGYRPDRLSFLKGFDVFALPSRSEGIPRCLMEAMSAEVPVVATDIPGCRYLIDGVTTGLLFKVDNQIELADAIKKLSSDDDLRKTIQQAGKNFIHTHFSSARMAQEYEQLFIKMM